MEQRDTHVYIMMNKPVDISTEDLAQILIEENYAGVNKKTVFQPVSPTTDTPSFLEGLVVLTNNSALQKNIENSEHHYDVTINEPLSRDAIAILTKGMILDDTFENGLTLSHLSNRGKRSVVTVAVTHKQPEKIQQMFEKIGYHVISVKRISVGNLKLGTLSTGKWKFFDKKNIL